MSESISKISAVSVPGVPAGTTPASPVVATPSPSGDSGHSVQPSVAPAKFGGNPTGRTRLDGLKPGSPEALDADKKKNAERMRLAREKERVDKTPPALPAAIPGDANSFATKIPVGDGQPDIALVGWSTKDFAGIAPSAISIIEECLINDLVDIAEEGGATAPLVKKIAEDAAFPRKVKESLQDSSPESLAKLFNALNVPTALKPYITTAPMVIYLASRHLRLRSNVRAQCAQLKTETKPEEKK